MANDACPESYSSFDSNTDCLKTVRKLVEGNVFHCEACGTFFKTAVYSVHGMGVVCQNCLDANKWQGERLRFFDVALQDLPVVPCTNTVAGCGIRVLPGDLGAHLEHCKFRPVNCISPGCSWQSKQHDLAKHFEEAHKLDVITEETPFSLNLAHEAFAVAKLLIKGNNKYLIFIRRELNSTHILYNVFKVKFGNVHGVTVRHFSGSSEDYRKHFETEELNVIDKTLALNRISLIVLKEISEGKNVVSLTVKVAKSNHEQMLICSGCGETMRPPIYQCGEQHNVCCFCFAKSSQCQVCRKQISGQIRSVSLEALTPDVYYSCTNQFFGCEARAPGREIDRHESNCSVAHWCPLPDCPYVTRSLEQIKQHGRSPHKQLLQGNAHEFILDLNYNQSGQRYVFFDGCFFEIQYSFKYNSFELICNNRISSYDINCTVKLLGVNRIKHYTLSDYVCNVKLWNVAAAGRNSEEVFCENILVTKSQDKESVFLRGKKINHGQQDARFNVCLYVSFKKFE